jgi:hypothetical protein
MLGYSSLDAIVLVLILVIGNLDPIGLADRREVLAFSHECVESADAI